MNSIIEIGSDGWTSLLAEIAANYTNGKLIKHEWLKEKFGLKELSLKDFPSVQEFLEARDAQQFSYMTLVDRMRWQLVSDFKVYIKNVRGSGYTIVPPSEQTEYGYDLFVSEVKKSFKCARLIMDNVLPVDSDQQAKDNDRRAKFAILQNMFRATSKI